MNASPRTMTDTELAEAVEYNQSLLVMLNKSLVMWTERGDDAHELGRAAERVRAVKLRLAELRHERAQRAAEAERKANTYYGYTVRDSYHGTRHFVNVWDETFCGRYVSGYETADDRATCKTCCKAGDSAMRNGTERAGGSPARRN